MPRNEIWHMIDRFHEIHQFTPEWIQRYPQWINLENLDILLLFYLSVPNISNKKKKNTSPVIFKYNALGIQLDERPLRLCVCVHVC